MSYSIKNALENVESNNTLSDSTGWKSPLDNSEKTIVIQIGLDSSHSFNRLSFELLDVPQKFSVFYKDQKRNKFVKIKTYSGFVEGTINGTRSGIENQNSWQSFQFSFPFINSDLIEIRINRINSLLPSFNLSKNTRYSIGIKNTQVRFHRTNNEISVINEDDEYKVNYFSPNFALAKDDTFWKSPPLGPNSLYPFYVDLRTDSGNAQVVEFMKLIPLYTDAHLNVYYSNDDSVGPFGLSNNQKTLNLIGETINLDQNWTKDKGILVQSPTYWQLSNSDIKLDLRSSFTIGFIYEPIDFTNTTINHYFWSFTSGTDTLRFYFDPQTTSTNYVKGNLVVKFNNEEKISFADVQFDKDNSYGITVGYNNHDFKWTISTCKLSTNFVSLENATSAFKGFYPETFNFSLNPATQDSSLGYARNLWARQDTFQINYVNSFYSNTDTFIRGLGSLDHRNNGYYNAVLVAPLTEDANVKVGPNVYYYDNKTWTPANRNFILNSSIYNLGRISAKYLKLEFAKPTVQYYNPATSEDVILSVLDFPDWVKEWYLMHEFDTTIDRTLFNNTLFEGKRILNNYSNSYGLNSFKSAIESSQNNLIFNFDQIGYDFFVSEANDDESLRNQIIRNALTLQFPTTSRHNYKTYNHLMSTKRAFFYGIVELSFFKQDQTLVKDNRVYFGDFLGEDIGSIDWVESSTGFFVDNGVAKSANQDDVIESKTFKSFSKFSGLQIAYLESPLKDLMSAEEINFVSTSHISTQGNADVSVVNNLKGTTDGKTILLKRNDDGFYGMETSSIDLLEIFDVASAADLPLAKFVAGCRVRSGDRNPLSYYELRLLSLINSEWKIVAKKQIKLKPNYEWMELDLIYNRSAQDSEFRLEIMHLDSFSDETLYVDMLGLWMERNRWEVSNDNGSNWVPVINNVNNAFGMVSFPSSGNELKIKITSNEASSWASEWLIVPIYDYVPVGMSTPRLFETSNADDPEYQDILDQKLFLPYSTQIPRNYSTMIDVINARREI